MASIPDIQAAPSVETGQLIQTSEPIIPSNTSTTEPPKESPKRRSPSPEPRAAENRLRPAGGELIVH